MKECNEFPCCLIIGKSIFEETLEEKNVVLKYERLRCPNMAKENHGCERKVF